MVTVDQVKRGVSNYAEREILPTLPGWRKWVFGGGTALVVANAERLLVGLAGSDLAKAMGLITADGQINLEQAYLAIRAQAETTGPVEIDVPVIGKLRVGAEDIERLYHCIMEA